MYGDFSSLICGFLLPLMANWEELSMMANWEELSMMVQENKMLSELEGSFATHE